MEENLEIKDFDILGLIELTDVKGIEKYVTPVKSNNGFIFQKYLSRSKEYYNIKTMDELSAEREELKELVTRMHNKRNFVILENMLNCSGKVYFKKMQQYIKNKTVENEKEMLQAKSCMEEDVRNILVILSKRGLITVDKSLKLPGGKENAERRIIEMDNKAMLYAFASTLEIEELENTEVLTPGYGSIYIGPFLKEIYGCEYTNLLKSKYIKETMPQTKKTNIFDLVNSERIFRENKKVLLLDDNIGTGQTMQEIKEQLKEENITDIKSGAVQFNWINYYRISVGEKTVDKKGEKIKRFYARDYDILSPINYYGHKLCEGAIDRLLSSGDEYVDYLKSKSYRLEDRSDIIGAIERGVQYSEMSNMPILDRKENINMIARKIRCAENVIDEYSRDKDFMSDEGRKSVMAIIRRVKDLVHDKQVFIER